MSELSRAEKMRYSRHLLLPEVGEMGQIKLKNSSVLIVGAGGLGCPVALYLAAAGVGRIGIIDFDKVDSSNLQRQVAFTQNDVGQPKAEVLATRLREMNAHIEVEVFNDRFSATNAQEILANYDVLVDGSDNFATRYLTNDASYLSKTPLIFGAVSRFQGQVSVFNADEQAPCYRCLFPDEPEAGTILNCAEAGVLGALTGVIGTLQAAECLKFITGIGELASGKFMTYDLLNANFSSFKLKKDKTCQLCGEHPEITELREAQVQCSAEIGTALSADDLKAILDADEALTLLDIREDSEREVFPLPVDSIHIPLSELTTRSAEIADDLLVCTVCQFGERARKARLILEKNGHSKALHLSDGLDCFFELYEDQG